MTDTQRQQFQARIDRAMARACEMAGRGVRPLLLSRDDGLDGTETYQVFAVSSRTQDGRIYRVELFANDEGEMLSRCECAAGGICWHRAAARLAALGLIGHDEAGAGVAAPGPDDNGAWGPAAPARHVTAAELSGRPLPPAA